jgi:hypothetical protein
MQEAKTKDGKFCVAQGTRERCSIRRFYDDDVSSAASIFPWIERNHIAHEVDAVTGKRLQHFNSSFGLRATVLHVNLCTSGPTNDMSQWDWQKHADDGSSDFHFLPDSDQPYYP